MSSLFPNENEIDVSSQVEQESRPYSYRTLEYPVEVLVRKLQMDDILIPDYQRNLVWNIKQKCYFIESVFLQIPISPMFGSWTEDGRINIVDGSQRVRCLRSFLENEFKLKDLEKLSSLNGYAFDDLPSGLKRTLLARDIRLILLTDSHELDVQFEIFRRVNSTATPLNDSEIRRGAFPGPFWGLIEECAEDLTLVQLTPMGAKKESRFEREELVLRFFAFGDRYQKFVHDVNGFLDQYLRDMNDEARRQPYILNEYRQRFEKAFSFIDHYMPGALSRGSRHQTPRTLFEAVTVGVDLAIRSNHSLAVSDLSWLEGAELTRVTKTDAANSGPRLRARIEYVRDALLFGGSDGN